MLTLKNSAPLRTAPVNKPQRVVVSRPVVSSTILSGTPLSDKCASEVDNGSMWLTMMRHGKKIARLGRPADQRKALIRSLVTQLIRYGEVCTTKVKAKAIRPFAERMISLAKDGSLHARRQALAFIYDKDLVKNLFEKANSSYGSRNGGYTRISAANTFRRGDAAEMARISLVDGDDALPLPDSHVSTESGSSSSSLESHAAPLEAEGAPVDAAVDAAAVDAAAVDAADDAAAVDAADDAAHGGDPR